jgi:hypothetical protein
VATTCKLITKTTLGSAATHIQFTSIPGTFDDLHCMMSVRSSLADPSLYWQYNGDGSSSYSLRWLRSDGSSASSASQSSLPFHRIDGGAAGTDSTANTFSSVEIYIPNYAEAVAKSCFVSFATENNATTCDMGAVAALFNKTDAITSLLIDIDGDFVSGSSFFLYGITKA